ncbi:MAG: hypothetical protein ACYC99_11480, partial [Candidatus Geothermincolia bacterium]
NYDPSLGRFNTPDPKAPEVADPMSFDTYLYCNDAALGRVDLMGTNSISDFFSGAWNCFYEYVLQPIGRFVSNVVSATASAAQAVLRTAVNALKTIARTTRSIATKIGKAMASAAKWVGRAATSVARDARKLLTDASMPGIGPVGAIPPLLIGVFFVVVVAIAVVVTVIKAIISDESPAPNAKLMKYLCSEQGTKAFELLQFHYLDMPADWKHRYDRTIAADAEIRKRLSDPKLNSPDAMGKKEKRDLDLQVREYVQEREKLHDEMRTRFPLTPPDPVRMENIYT